MIKIREIEKDDNEKLAWLIRDIFRELDMPREGTVFSDPRTDYLSELFETPGSKYWVAEDDDNILGGCGIFPTNGLPEGCVELVKFYLSPDSRGKGLGRELMERSIDSAKLLGYRQVYLESFPELTRAVTLYEKAGFRVLDNPLGNSGHPACNLWMIKNL